MSLAGLLLEPRADSMPVAVGGEACSWRDLRHATARLAGALEPGRWVVASDDAYAFAVGLLAVAQAGGEALLPPNLQPGTLRDLAAGVRGIVGVDPGDVGLRRVDPLNPPSSTPLAPRCLEPEAAFVELFTSGTTGRARRVRKRVAHLEAELEALEKLFGARLGEAALCATVSPRHLYGLLFALLWPLSRGRAFARRAAARPVELLRFGGRPFALATTPAFLRRMRDAELCALAPDCRLLFSSGSALDGSTAKRVAAALGSGVVEIFGSTETGGVARREGSATWTTLPGVAIELGEGDRLRVSSAFVSEPGGSFLMGDRAQLGATGDFQLLGRVDRVIKVGDKRLSLDEMEAELERHACVSRAALHPLASGRLGAVIELSAPGREFLEREGRRRLGGELREWLERHWERILVPRSWRYVERLPENAQGKTTSEALDALFRRRPTLPEIHATQRGEGTARWRCRVPEDLAFLEGHFPGQPVVAGVAQLHWVMRLARELIGQREIQGVEALKFKHLLLPGQVFELEVQLDSEASKLRFELRGDPGRVFSSGRVILS